MIGKTHVTSLILIAFFACGPGEPKAYQQLILDQTRPFDFDLAQLPVYKDQAFHFDKRYFILFYFSELSCSACVSRELKVLLKQYPTIEPGIDFVILAYETNHFYLKNLQRINRLKQPIFLEDFQGQVGFPNMHVISLVDLEKREILLRFFPRPEPELEGAVYLFLKKVREKVQR